LVDHAAVTPGQRLLLVARRDQLLHMAATAALVAAAGGCSGVRVLIVFDPAASTFLVVRAELNL